MIDKRKTSIGSAIATTRKLVGMTQRRLATLAGLSTQWIVTLEQGEKSPSLEAIDAIAAALGVPTFVLFLETENADSELRMTCRARYVLPAANKERESEDSLKRRRGISEALDESGFVANLFKEEG